MFKLAVVGSKGFRDYEKLKKAIQPFRDKGDIAFITAGGDTTNVLTLRYANERKIACIVNDPPENFRYSINYYKNILKDADGLLAFWHTGGLNVLSALKAAKALNKPHKIVMEKHATTRRYTQSVGRVSGRVSDQRVVKEG